MKALDPISKNSFYALFALFLVLIFMSYFLDDDHHVDLALMVVPSMISFGITIFYIARRIPW